MAYIQVTGGHPLEGKVEVHGSKNAVLPILAATLLNGGKSVIHHCPDLSDVRISLEILQFLGCSVTFENGTVTVDSTHVENNYIPDELMRQMRSSIVFLGAILARKQSAVMSYPGGCEIGPRPIDLHLKAFRELGIRVDEAQGFVYCEAKQPKPTCLHLDFPSVGATENILLTAALAEGTTVLTNAAREPEIVDLQNFLNAMGAKIRGAGGDVIRITGVGQLHDTEYTVIPDRIVASTYLAAALSAGGMVEIAGINPRHISAFIAIARECGARILTRRDSIVVAAPQVILPIDIVHTSPYPGFPTDAQSLLMSVLACARGTSIIRETIFEGRFKHAAELARMGADIRVTGKSAVIRGVRELSGCSVDACDLRSGAALVVAGLRANGITKVGNVFHIDRGYESLESDLRALGAEIERVE